MSDDLLKKMMDVAFVNPFANPLVNSVNMNRPLVDNGDQDPKAKQEMNTAIIEKVAKDDLYKRAVLGSLQGIEKNAGNLAEVIAVLRSVRGEKQEEIFNLLTDILALGKARSKKEAETAYRAVMKKIQDYSGELETVRKLQGLVDVVFSMVQAMF